MFWMNRRYKKFLYDFAHGIKEFIEMGEPPTPFEIPYYKKQEAKVKEIFKEVLGDDIKHVKFVEMEMTKDEKRLLWVNRLLLLFLFYVLIFFIWLLASLIFGMPPLLTKFMDLFNYIGNVFAIGLSFFMIQRGMKAKQKGFIPIGILCLVLNVFSIINFYQTYG